MDDSSCGCSYRCGCCVASCEKAYTAVFNNRQVSPIMKELPYARPPGSRCPNWCWSLTGSSLRKPRLSARRWRTFSNAPQPGCPWELDGKAISDQVGPEAHGRAELLCYARHQAVLIYVNAYDHLLTLGRIRFRHRAGAGAGPRGQQRGRGPSRQHAPRVLRR